jgi:thiol-disulfide isomerase/thioredoxin
VQARRLRFLAVAVVVVVVAAAFALASSPDAAAAASSRSAAPVTIYYFWGDGCPHCASLRPFLDELAALPGVELSAFEVWNDEGNRELFRRVAAAYGTEAGGVPAVFVAGGAWVGDAPSVRSEIAATVVTCLEAECTDVAGAVVGGREQPPAPPPAPEEDPDGDRGTVIDLPLLGSHDVGGDSLLWATAVIAFVDGFNPCSLWVLTILIAMILRTRSRARVALIGGTYVTTAAAVYGLFLIGLFSVLTIVDYEWWLRVAVALFALGFAAVNIKDYVWFGRGVSFTIPERFKPRIARGARSLAFEDRRLPVVVGATAGLAAAVSLLELPCTVGFPVVWTNLLAERGVANAEYAFLLTAYLLIFLLDEIGILVVALVAMRIGRVQERHGRVLKLGGGMLMAVLAAVMLVDPGLLQDVRGAGLAFGAAAVLTAAAMLVHGAAQRRRTPPRPRPPLARRPAHRHR